MRERDIKAKPSVTKSSPHQAPFAPQEELPQRAAALLHPEKCPALQPYPRPHHLTSRDIGAATAAAPLHLNAWQNPALQPCVHRRHITPGDIGAAAAAAALRFDTWQNARRCSHVCAAATSCLGTLALQLPLRRCILTPGKTLVLQPCVRRRHITPGDIGPLRLDTPAAVCALLPCHARGHWRCSHHCAAASWCPSKRLALQPCACRHHITPGDIGAAAAAVPLCLDARQNAFTLAKTPRKMPRIVVIFQNWKKIQKSKLQSNASVLLRWQHNKIKLLNKLSQFLLCTKGIDEGLLDCCVIHHSKVATGRRGHATGVNVSPFGNNPAGQLSGGIARIRLSV